MKKILVIDDADYIVRDIRTLFQGHDGYEVVGPKTVTSYSQAMELIREFQPDAIALDMSLTSDKKEGIEIAAELSYSGFAGIVSVISSYDVDEVMGWVAHYGVKHYAGGKDAKKFADCVLGACECEHWGAYLSVKNSCRDRKIERGQLSERILVSMRSKGLAVTSVRRLLRKLDGNDRVAIEVVDPESLSYSLDLASGIPAQIVSDFVGSVRVKKVRPKTAKG